MLHAHTCGTTYSHAYEPPTKIPLIIIESDINSINYSSNVDMCECNLINFLYM